MAKSYFTLAQYRIVTECQAPVLRIKVWGWYLCVVILLIRTGSGMVSAQNGVNGLSESEKALLKSWMCTYAYPGILPTKENFLLAVVDQQGKDAAVLRTKLQAMSFQFYSLKDTILFVESSSEETSMSTVLKESIKVDRAACLHCPIDAPTQIEMRRKLDERYLKEIQDSLNRWKLNFLNKKYELAVFAYIKGLKRERISARLAFYKVNNNWSVDVVCGNSQVVQHFYFSRDLIGKMSALDAFKNVTRIELSYECFDYMEVFVPPWPGE